MITTVIVWWQFFLLKKWTKVRAYFFIFCSEQASGIIFNIRPPVKMVDFHGEVTFIGF
jgi:hypothetical protein